MIKIRTISPYSDLKTSLLSKIFIIAGTIFLLVYILFLLFSFFENIQPSIVAFSILFFGLGFILYFMSLQFAKLAQIAHEIESEDEIECTK